MKEEKRFNEYQSYDNAITILLGMYLFIIIYLAFLILIKAGVIHL